MSDSNTSAPIFQIQSTLDDELQLEFAPPPSGGAIYITEDDAVSSPVTQYRDIPFEFTTASMDHLETLDNLSFFPTAKQPAGDQQQYQSKQKQMTASPLSPSGAVEVPVKEGWDSVFSAAYLSFPSTANPEKIMTSLQNALTPFDCTVRIENRWTLRVSWLCVAEEIAFSVSLVQEQGHSRPQYEVAFRREFGDEAVFLQLVECVRARCSDVDMEPLFFAEATLEPWLDAKQELKGRRYAIADTEAAQLIKEMNAQLDADTLYEVIKVVKNHCRHRGNRRLFLEVDRSGFTQALKWMLADSEVLARFAVFILLQYAKESGDDESDDIFSGEAAGLGICGKPLVSGITSNLAGMSVSSYAVDYLASMSQTSAGPGATDMTKHVVSVAQECPDTVFILGGYSQGASVTDISIGIKTTLGSGDTIPETLSSRIKAIVTFGNPLKLTGQTIESASPTYGSKAFEFCNTGDPVCGNGFNVMAHLTYATDGSVKTAAEKASALVKGSTRSLRA
ncbi:hypothetical protein BBJ29_001698 [Phytophthora kernoviae]|uniref:Cutinase n=1 Tax=Phytophthora kernoviae TaxID=325452 RepID=A0A3F2S1Z1_9STRA|nr:hypothetical protein BBJ29_001698 [Phytophthora kernoviae]RLN68772.1 hypothetical protein BBP00_00000817 [Phytophthora kernoviae]